MELAEYKELTPKTIKPLGSEQMDCVHMIIGMFSELNELADALTNDDEVNVQEEVGDFSWYLTNYANIRAISITHKKFIGGYSYNSLVYEASKLSDIVKKFLVYGKEIDREAEAEQVQVLVDIVTHLYFKEETQKMVDIEKAWELNINKLHKIRYKNATYSDQQAIERNTEEERKELEK